MVGTRSKVKMELNAVLQNLAQSIADMKTNHVPPPTPYKGIGSVSDFFAAFDRYACAQYKVDYQSYLQILPNFLEGEAKAIALSYGSGSAVRYEDVKERIIREMNRRNCMGANSMTDFFSIKRLPGESLTCFVIRLENSAVKVEACPTAAAQRELVRSKFLNSLPDPVVTKLTEHFGYMDAVELEKVVRLASIFEEHMGLSPNAWPVNPVAATAPAPGVPRGLGNLHNYTSPSNNYNSDTPNQNLNPSERYPPADHRNDQPTPNRNLNPRERYPSPSPRNNPRGNVRCYNCQGQGHYARDCTQRSSRSSGNDSGTGGRNDLRGNRGTARRSSPENPPSFLCMFCGIKGHVFADCEKFQRRCMACNWCGSIDHVSHQCPNKPGGSGN